jgi:carboxyl-terminal processing protease
VKRSASIPLILFAQASGCTYMLVDDEPEPTPTAVFEQVWSDFDQYYGLFAVKGVDWDAQHAELAPLVHDELSDAELYALLIQLLEPLDDKHVSLFPTGTDLPTWSVDLVDGHFPTPAFDLELIRAEYLDTWIAPHPLIAGGRLEAGTIGYIHIGGFEGSERSYRLALDELLDALADVDAMIIDIRDNPGGFDPLAQSVAGRFASERALYMTVRKRVGPDRDDFGEPVEWYVEPSDDQRFTGPVALLTTHATQSAGETFALALLRRADIVQIGGTTAGAFSDNIMREAGNGWTYTISVGDYRDHLGNSYEGIGLAPDIAIENTLADLEARRDPTLEQAIEQLSP